MSAPEWLIVIALAALALWVVAGVVDERAARRPLPRIAQSVRRTPLLPPTRQRSDLPRWSLPDLRQARTVRRSRARQR